MRLSHLWLTDFRNYRDAHIEFVPDGLTVVIGDNGQGKTSLLEAIAWLATLESFRHAPVDALVRQGCERAMVRAEGERDTRRLLVEGEVRLVGRARIHINRQPLRRSRDLLGALRVSMFTPDDLVLVKGAPAERRRYLDDLLVACHPKWDDVRSKVDRTLRQRGALLKQAGGRLTPEVALTLDVWDAKLAAAGTELADARADLAAILQPAVATAYDQVAGASTDTRLVYAAAWREPDGPGLAEALVSARVDDLRRGMSTVGPHRDDLALTLGGMPARTHASQGEQRSLALALRLGGHRVVTETVASPPVLLLDDVFSELDARRTASLVDHLPEGQAVLTTTGPIPSGVVAGTTVRVNRGDIVQHGTGA